MATPYIGLDLPVVTVTLGPEWAEKLNAALELIDDHDHTSGKGRLITSAALNINDDVSINDNNLTNSRSYQMSDQNTPLADPTDVRSIYAASGELYYNDSVGNQVQITAGGALNAASVGGIGGDYGTSTASVYYSSVSKTFFFDQNTNQRAKLDIGDLIIRETLVGTNGITIKSPSSLASAYTLTLPAALPASTLPVHLSNTGVLSTDYIHTAQIDPAGLGSSAYATGSVGTTALADDSVTAAKIDPAASIVKVSRQVFNSTPGVYPLVLPFDVNQIIARGCGGGGGGGAGYTSTNGGGAGAGAQVKTNMISVTPSVAKTFAPSDVNVSSEEITITAHGYAENQAVIFTSTGTLPGGLTASTVVYYMKSVAANTFQVSATIGGAAVNLTTQGTGTHTVRSCLAVTLGAGGTGAVVTSGNGTAGANSQISSGVATKTIFPGAAGGIGGLVGTNGIGGTNFTWDNISTSGGDGGVAGGKAPNADGVGGAATGSGGGGGGSIGNGGNGANVGGALVATTGTFGGGGGGGGATGGPEAPGANGGSGYVDVIYWENVNP